MPLLLQRPHFWESLPYNLSCKLGNKYFHSFLLEMPMLHKNVVWDLLLMIHSKQAHQFCISIQMFIRAESTQTPHHCLSQWAGLRPWSQVFPGVRLRRGHRPVSAPGSSAPRPPCLCWGQCTWHTPLGLRTRAAGITPKVPVEPNAQMLSDPFPSSFPPCPWCHLTSEVLLTMPFLTCLFCGPFQVPPIGHWCLILTFFPSSLLPPLCSFGAYFLRACFMPVLLAEVLGVPRTNILPTLLAV